MINLKDYYQKRRVLEYKRLISFQNKKFFYHLSIDTEFQFLKKAFVILDDRVSIAEHGLNEQISNSKVVHSPD